MHSIFHGVVKELFHYWFDLRGGDFSLKDQMETINERLLSITPPQFLQTAPRPLSEWKNYRAHEFLHFILFYSLSVFCGIMDIDYLNHLKSLVIALEVLSTTIIRRTDLFIVEKLLFKFVSEITTLYDKKILNSGFHELLHFSDLTLSFGPLNITSLFQYEEMNRKILTLIHGKNLIGEEFIKVFTISQNLTRFTLFFQDNNPESKTREFILKYCQLRSSNRKVISNSGVRRVGKSKEKCNDEDLLELVSEFDGQTYETLDVYFKLIYNNRVFTAFKDEYSTKRFGNFCIYDKMSKKCGMIAKFLSNDNDYYVLCQQFVELHNPFFVLKYNE